MGTRRQSLTRALSGCRLTCACGSAPCAVYCGTAEQAVHLQVTGSSCNVTVFDINQLYTAVTNPTTPCDHSIYNKTCTVFAGTLLIDISPAIDPNSGNFYKQSNPDVQARTCRHPSHSTCLSKQAPFQQSARHVAVDKNRKGIYMRAVHAASSQP